MVGMIWDCNEMSEALKIDSQSLTLSQLIQWNGTAKCVHIMVSSTKHVCEWIFNVWNCVQWIILPAFFLEWGMAAPVVEVPVLCPLATDPKFVALGSRNTQLSNYQRFSLYTALLPQREHPIPSYFEIHYWEMWFNFCIIEKNKEKKRKIVLF